jgi:hypothetical protein
MDDQSATPELLPVSPAAARAALHRIIERLTDEEVTAFWQLVCSWGAAPEATDRQAGREQLQI